MIKKKTIEINLTAEISKILHKDPKIWSHDINTRITKMAKRYLVNMPVSIYFKIATPTVGQYSNSKWEYYCGDIIIEYPPRVGRQWDNIIRIYMHHICMDKDWNAKYTFRTKKVHDGVIVTFRLKPITDIIEVEYLIPDDIQTITWAALTLKSRGKVISDPDAVIVHKCRAKILTLQYPRHSRTETCTITDGKLLNKNGKPINATNTEEVIKALLDGMGGNSD